MKLENSYHKLPKDFYCEQLAHKIQNPELIIFNKKLAQELNIEVNFDDKELAQIFSGNQIVKNSKPIALAYAGHQFGHFVPCLGDGRALLIGEVLDKNKQRFDLQLKGSGRTIFSRNGDGKYPIGPAIREYIVSEAMYFLGIKTSRSLALVATNEFVQRETTTNGAILTRVAQSHIRVGTFEYFAAKEDLKNIKILADYSINRHYPKCANNYLSFFENVIKDQAKLISSWMCVGFIHGVMNTDNTAISGHTIDYGPCAFMDQYKRDEVFSYIDRRGRYSFSNQKNIILWNLTKFGEAILPLIDKDIDKGLKLASDELNKFHKYFTDDYFKNMAQKIGIFNFKKGDEDLVNQFLEILEKNKIDFTNGFRILSKVLLGKDFYVKNKEYKDWQNIWKKRVTNQNLKIAEIAKKMDKINPVLIPRNHIIERIIQKVVVDNDFEEFKNFLKMIENPFVENEKYKEYYLPPEENEKIGNTFCGT